eukprot:gene9968-13408_t
MMVDHSEHYTIKESILNLLDEPQNSVKDRSYEARTARLKMLGRSIYGEFVGTTIYFVLIFGCLVNGFQSLWDVDILTLAISMISGLQITALIMCFSNISGAQFNLAISFSLWMTNKLSNRKFFLYIIAQLMASIAALSIVYVTFSDINEKTIEFCVVKPRPGADLYRVFLTEFICTFILTYVAFTIAYEEEEIMKKTALSVKSTCVSNGLVLYSCTPQSKAGFAPFAIGLTVFSLCLYGGSSSIAMNPVRIFAPALFSGIWDNFYIYVIAEFMGALSAAYCVINLQGITPDCTPNRNVNKIEQTCYNECDENDPTSTCLLNNSIN